jgi:hypothetical protein
MTPDQVKVYRAALKEARESFNQASTRQREIEMESSKLAKETARLRRTITALAAMCSEDPGIDSLGITDACMEVLLDWPGSATTNDVVTMLESMGFDISSQKNASASVHSVLGRLARNGKITKIEDDVRGVLWRGPAYDKEFDEIPF